MLEKNQICEYYNALAPRLTNYLLGEGLSYEQACDITQESFVRLWQRREFYSATDSISGLIFQIARNLRIDYFRQNCRLIPTDNFDNTECQETPEQMHEDEKRDEYLCKCLHRAIAVLPHDLRTAYTMSRIGGLSVREIAKTLSISESLVKVRVFRAKEKLREQLGYLKVSEMV